MVRYPREYRWSSYGANALGEADPIFAGDLRDKSVAVCLHDPDTGQYWDPGMWWANDWGKALERMRKAKLG